jgi:hypothetical protein
MALLFLFGPKTRPLDAAFMLRARWDCDSHLKTVTNQLNDAPLLSVSQKEVMLSVAVVTGHLDDTVQQWQARALKESPSHTLWSSVSACLLCATRSQFAPSLVQAEVEGRPNELNVAYQLAVDARIRLHDSAGDLVASRARFPFPDRNGGTDSLRQRALKQQLADSIAHRHAVTLRASRQMTRRLCRRLAKWTRDDTRLPLDQQCQLLTKARDYTLSYFDRCRRPHHLPKHRPTPILVAELKPELKPFPEPASEPVPKPEPEAPATTDPATDVRLEQLSCRARELSVAASACVTAVGKLEHSSGRDALLRGLLPAVILFERIAERAMPKKERPCGQCPGCLQRGVCLHHWSVAGTSATDAALMDACFGPGHAPSETAPPILS